MANRPRARVGAYPAGVSTASPTSVGAAFLGALRDQLPALRLLTEPADTEAYRWDETEYMHPGMPLGVVFPTSTADVSTIMRLATEHRVPVVPRGAGSGVSGGAIAVEGALTVVLTGMRSILEIDTRNLLVVTQPGVINADLGRAVAEHGLFYPPDPASFEICSIGGNLAENSGGLRCVKYGVTRDYVLGLEVVLADGSVDPDGRPNGQGRHGLRPDAAAGRLGRNAGHHHGGDPAVAPDASAQADHARLLPVSAGCR